MISVILARVNYFFLKLLSFLPFSLLNFLGNIIFFLLDKVIHYRQEIILKNLNNAFPKKTMQERRKIKKEYYRYFSRLIIENIKMFSLSLNKLEKYITLDNPELIDRYYKAGVNVAVIAAHYGNWEWLLGLRKNIPHQSIGIYKEMNNRRFDSLFKRHRSKYGSEMVSMREIPRILNKFSQNDILSLTVFISDQSPVWEEIQYWTKFLGQDTPVYLGPEKLARKMKMAVVYFRVKVNKKNRYSVEAVPVTDDASKTGEYEVTERYMQLLEDDIRRKPEYWLWSHRRWKLTEKRLRLEEKGEFRFDGKFRRK